MTLLGEAKRAAERMAVAAGLPHIARFARRRDALILAYHNIVPQGEAPVGDVSLHLPQRNFARQLELLAETHDIVPLASLFETPAARHTRPRAVITFDDAYRGAMTGGLEELTGRGIPFTVFVTPGHLGGNGFWWDLIADPILGLTAAHREHALFTLRGEHEAVLRWARESGTTLQDPPAHAMCVTESELAHAARYDGLTIASHTWSHPNLMRLATDELHAELERSAGWLRRFDGRTINAVSYPYGMAGEREYAATSRIGYDMGFMISGGWFHATRQNGLAYPRLNIPAGVSDDGFRLRDSGVLAR